MSDGGIPVIFLPGVVMPAALAYPALVEALGPDVDARPKELEIYASDSVPADWSLRTEVDGILRVADDAGFDRFHLVGYSAGGACSLMFCAAHPDRLLSLTLAEPAWAGNEGLSPEELAVRREFDHLAGLPPAEMMAAFVRAQVREGVEPPPPPPGDPPPWMRLRPAGIAAFTDVFASDVLALDRLRAFDRPVLFALGGLSNPRYYGELAKRLGSVFPDFTLEIFEDRHHFDPPHRAEPMRFAESLRALWARAAT